MNTKQLSFTAEEIDQRLVKVDELAEQVNNLIQEEPSYTNVLPMALADDGINIYNGIGYQANTRWSSSQDTDIYEEGIYITGYIPVKENDTIYLKNIIMPTGEANGTKVHSFTEIGVESENTNGTMLDKYCFAVRDEAGNLISFKNTIDCKYIRIQCDGIDKSSIITINQRIPEDEIESRVSNIEAELEELNDRVAILENSDHTDGIPDYWTEALEKGAQSINAALCAAGRNKSAFLFYSDVHWNYGSQMSPKLLKYLYKHTGITKTFFGGDIVNSEGSDYDTMKYLWDWRSQLKDLPNHHSVVGNHDDGTGDNNGGFSESYLYGYLIAPEETLDMVMGDGLYYYIDNTIEKTRYVFLNTAAYSVFDANQEEWLKQILINTPANWHIIPIAHVWYEPDYSNYDKRPIDIAGMYVDAKKICNILDEYNNRENAFINCEAKVEFCIGGHVHRDYVGYSEKCKIPIILVETDSWHIRGSYSYIEGTKGTDEASVNGIVANYTKREVNVVRIGRGQSYIVSLDNENELIN